MGCLPEGATIVGNTGDPSLKIWDMEWVPFTLGHHLNPLVTDYLHYPGGANLMWNASIIFPALVLAPLTDLFGPLASHDVVAVLGVSLSAWCACLAVRRYTTGWLPAAVGGLLYGFSPYMAPPDQARLYAGQVLGADIGHQVKPSLRREAIIRDRGDAGPGAVAAGGRSRRGRPPAARTGGGGRSMGTSARSAARPRIRPPRPRLGS